MITQNTSPVYVNRVHQDWMANGGVYGDGGVYYQSASNTPTLNFQFAGATAISSQITFTRSTTARYFNSAGVLTSAAINAPRLDYNPSTLAAQGLLIEEARTNSIRNNTMVGAVAGTPGTDPTNWAVSTTGSGITKQIMGVGTESGIAYVDIRYSGTPSAGTNVGISFEQPNQIAASAGQMWAEAAYIKLQAGSFANTSTTVSLLGTDGASGTEVFNSAVITSTPTNLSQCRFSVTGTLAAALGTTHVQPRVRIGYTSGAAIDITLRIGLPQLELGAFATSVIPTSTIALTRAADVASVNTLSPWYNAVEGTLYAEFAITQPSSGSNQFVGRFSDNTYNNSIADNVNTTGFMGIATASGGVFDGLASTVVAVTANTITKFAGAYAANNLAACKDGGTVGTDNTATIPSGLTRLDLGSDHAGANRVKAGYIRRVTYYPRRLSDAELVSLTS